MKITIKTKDIELTPDLQEFIEEKMNSLEKFSSIFEGDVYNGFFGKGQPKVEAWVEVGKDTRRYKKGPFFFAECQMRFPKKSLRSVAFAKNLKRAINEVRDEMERQIKKYEEKQKNL